MSSRAFLFLTLALAAACAGVHGGRPPDRELSRPAADFRLGPEDVIEIVVWDNPALSRTVPVRPDGMISLPMVDDVAAAGLTPMQLRDMLVARLRRFLPDPQVSIIVQEVHSPKVVVVGEVAKPGRYELGGPTTLLDAIALAGGFTEFASSSSIVLVRARGERVQRYRVDRDSLTGAGRDTVWVAPGDVVMVP